MADVVNISGEINGAEGDLHKIQNSGQTNPNVQVPAGSYKVSVAILHHGKPGNEYPIGQFLQRIYIFEDVEKMGITGWIEMIDPYNINPYYKTMTVEDTTAFTLQTREMFTSIAPRYDFLNRLLSVGQDKYWRQRAIDLLDPMENERILDVATGTGDMVIEVAKRNLSVQIFGIDFSQRMLDLGRIKIARNGYNQAVSLQIGSGECLPFADESFDGVICAFGIRNFGDAQLGLREFFRVLKPGGRVVVLEFSIPQNQFLKTAYEWYFNLILPKIGNIISGHSNAYSYLPESVANFPSQKKFIKWIEKIGFKKVSFSELTFGIVSIHRGYKVSE